MAQNIKNLLQTILKTEHNWKVHLLKNWPDIIGDLKSKVQLEKIQETTLVLSVIDACWLQELYLLSPLLLRAINQKLDRPRIKHLRFKQAGIKKERKKYVVRKNNRTQKKVTLSPTERRALKKINDSQLCDALERFLVRCYQEK